LCPTAADISPFEVPIRPFGKTRVADQVAVLAKVLFTNSFQGCLSEGEHVRNQVRPSEFPKD
jgi:hypothetical protein